MAIQTIRNLWVATLVWTLGASALASETLKLELQSSFEGNFTGRSVNPIVADIQNLGPDARGVLVVSADGNRTDYPVELPRGAKKRIITYPAFLFGTLHFSLETDQGKVDKEYNGGGSNPDGIPVLLISDTSGDLGFIRRKPTAQKIQINPGMPPDPEADNGSGLTDAYAKPEMAPARAVGYTDIGKVILGSGSERLSNEQVAALKLWCLQGGTIVFIGGVSSPVLADTRWASLIPAAHLHLTQLGGESSRENFIRENPNTSANKSTEGFLLVDGSPMPRASVTTGAPVFGGRGEFADNCLVWADAPHGLGKTIFISFNPFEAPIRSWEGRQKLLTRILKQNSTILAASYLSQYNGQVGGDRMWTGTAFVPTAGTVPPPLASAKPTPIEDDPFSMVLPPTERIMTILLAYFVVVVPVNFLLLKKLKRGELAWFTAPIISLAFAAILFTSAGSLYSGKMSTVTNGLVFAQEGDSEGWFIGTTQMFIPRAGSYDLHLSNIDSLGSIPNEQQAYRGYSVPNEDTKDLEPVDTGEILVTNLPANNLAFRKISYKQRIPISSWIHVVLESEGKKSARCDITNSSPYTIGGAQLAVGGELIVLGNLPPGKHVSVQVEFKSNAKDETYPVTDIRTFTLNKPRVALVGTMNEFHPGPQIGQPIPSRSATNIAIFSAWKGGQP